MTWLYRTLVCVVALATSLGSAAHADEPVVPPARDQVAPTEGPTPVIELYTMGRGALTVEKFGHAALCVRYPKTPSADTCYNYGTTDFGDPLALGWGFIRGNANFWVSTTTPTRMLEHYRDKDRSIWLQRLPLSRARALAVEDKLLADDGLQYTYHHFFDNCTTRVRDIVDMGFEGALSHNSADKPGPTFREYGRAGFAEQAWLLVVSDVLLGHSGDDRPTLWQAMFLPYILRAEVETRLGVKPTLVYKRGGRTFASTGSSGRGWVILFALIIAFPVAITRVLRRAERLGAAVSVLPIGLLGLVLWGIAIVSGLSELRYNEALLVFMPWDLALPLLGVARRTRYARVRLVGLSVVALLLAVGALTQPLLPAMLCVALPMTAIAWKRA